MSAGLGVVRQVMLDETRTRAVDSYPIPNSATSSNSAQFAREQVRGLVRRLFVPGWPHPRRQVVFSAADYDSDVSFVCRLVAEVLVDCPAKICVVEANVRTSAVDHLVGGTRHEDADVLKQHAMKQTSSFQVSQNLFVVPATSLFSPKAGTPSMRSAQMALNELREEFDFTIIHGDCAATSSSTCLLAHLVDGIVLGVTANRTRKAVAQKIQENLAATDVRLLGIVLCERTFPIPESLYRRL